MISGVVLAAGTGSRFGGTKQIVVVHGKPLAQHAIDALEAAGVDEVIVVTGHDAVKVASALTLPPQARIVYNAAFKDGQATSLAAAIHALDDESEAVVILMADQPGVEVRRHPRVDRPLPRHPSAGRPSDVRRRSRTVPALTRDLRRSQDTSTATSARAS